MNGTTVIPIAPEDRTMAALTHLSGLSGYIIPFGGVLVPIIIWMMKKGDNRSNPFSNPLRCCSSSEEIPPMPEPTMTPTFSGM